MPQGTAVELTTAEWRLVEAALGAFVSDFGHDEADVIEQLRTILAKLPVLGTNWRAGGSTAVMYPDH